jgi:hypothetical protein
MMTRVAGVGHYPLINPEGDRFEQGRFVDAEMTPWIAGQIAAGAMQVEAPEPEPEQDVAPVEKPVAKKK